MIEYFKIATEPQQKDLVLMFWLMDRQDDLSELSKNIHSFAESLNSLTAPDTDGEITTGSQQDMLWAEFFATGRVQPLRQLLISFDLSEHLGTLEKIENKEIEPSAKIYEKTMLEAVFQAGLWSIRSNCMQSDLCFKYCIALYRYGDLPDNQNHILGMILKQVSEDKQSESFSKPWKPDDSAAFFFPMLGTLCTSWRACADGSRRIRRRRR